MKSASRFILFAATALALCSAQGIITTVAGNGTLGYSGDNGQAISAKLNIPSDMAVDAAGNIYVVDRGNNVVRKVDPSGVITTLAGNGTMGYAGDGGPATAAELFLRSRSQWTAQATYISGIRAAMASARWTLPG
jgi:hypothetical protein